MARGTTDCVRKRRKKPKLAGGCSLATIWGSKQTEFRYSRKAVPTERILEFTTYLQQEAARRQLVGFTEQAIVFLLHHDEAPVVEPYRSRGHSGEATESYQPSFDGDHDVY